MKSVVYMRVRTLCAGVVLFMIYSALLITLTLSLTSRSDGDLLVPVSSLRVCQERVHWAVFVIFFFSLYGEKKKMILLNHTLFFFLLFTSADSVNQGGQSFQPKHVSEGENQVWFWILSPFLLRWNSVIVGLSCQSWLALVNVLQS